MTTISPPHIRLDQQGVVWIDDTNIKVIEVVLDRLAYGWSPEEIHFQHPHLSLARVYAALAYYYDHQSELDAQIARQGQEVRRMREPASEPPLVTRLKASGLLSKPRVTPAKKGLGMDSQVFDRITIEPGKMNGQPCIRGLRLTVRRVLEGLSSYPTREELQADYPELDEEDIRQAIAYAAAMLGEEIVEMKSAS